MSAPALPDAAFGRLPSVALPSLPDPLAAVQAILDAIMSIVRGIIQSIIKPLLGVNPTILQNLRSFMEQDYPKVLPNAWLLEQPMLTP